MSGHVVLRIGSGAAPLRATRAEVHHEVERHGTLRAWFCASPGQLAALESHVGKEVRAVLRRDAGEVELFRGVVERSAVTCAAGGRAREGRLLARTSSARLDLLRGQRTFRDQEVREVVRRVVAAARLRADLGGGLGAHKLPHVLQFGETDFELIVRLCQGQGWLLTTHGLRGVRVRRGFEAAPAARLDLDRDLLAYEVGARLLPPCASGLHHDQAQNRASTPTGRAPARAPTALLALHGVVRGRAADLCNTRFSPYFQDARHDAPESFCAALEAEAEVQDASRLFGEGCSLLPTLAPGQRVAIANTGAHDGACNVVAVTHRFDCDPRGEGPRGYANVFRTTYGALPPSERRAAARAPGLTTGVVVENHDAAGQGRLQVALRWQGDEHTVWIRRATLYGGAERGLYFTPEKGDEVLVAFLDGQLERPVVVGALWNGEQPVAAEARHPQNDVKEIKTRAGSRVTFRETAGKASITVQTPEQRCRVEMTNEGPSRVAVFAQGEVSVTAQKGDVKVEASQGSVSVTAARNVSLCAGKDMDLKAGGKLAVEARSVSVRAAEAYRRESRSSEQRASGAYEVRCGRGTLDADGPLRQYGSPVDLNPPGRGG